MRWIVLLFLFVATLGSSIAQEHCAAYMGGSWFINCKSLVNFQGQDVVTFSDWADPIASVNIDVFGSDQRLQAQVRNGKLVKGSTTRFLLKSDTQEFSLVDGSTDRVICILKRVPSTTASANCQVNVWLDLFVSGAGYFHCDPECSNDPVLNMLGSATFSNSESAISLY